MQKRTQAHTHHITSLLWLIFKHFMIKSSIFFFWSQCILSAEPTNDFNSNENFMCFGPTHLTLCEGIKQWIN